MFSQLCLLHAHASRRFSELANLSMRMFLKRRTRDIGASSDNKKDD